MPRKMDDHLKEKGTYFISVTHDLDLAQEIIKVLPDFTYWAYIYHEPDQDNSTPHYHFMVRNNGTRSVWQIADKLGISGQYVQVCRHVVAQRRYFLHLDDDDKKKYSLEDIHTNRLASFKEAMIGNNERDVHDFYRDWRNLCIGNISVSEFIQLNYIALNKLNFYQKIKTFEAIDKVAHDTT